MSVFVSTPCWETKFKFESREEGAPYFIFAGWIGYLKISAPVLFDVRKNAVSFLNKNAGLFSGGAKP